MLLGATYSHREVEGLKLDQGQSFQTTLDLHLDLLRLGIYWDESESLPGVFDFESIERLLVSCDRAKQRVVVTVGAKAPRWPEYYLPEWLVVSSVEQVEKPLLQFVEAAVGGLRHHPSIYAWQVENEPFDYSGPLKWRVPESLLGQEAALVRHLDPGRPIHLNLWGDNILRRADRKAAVDLADSIGIDLYYRQPAGPGQYHGPNFRDWQLWWWIWRQAKPVWITELQAEPWEQEDAIKFSTHPPSLMPDQLIDNVKRAAKLRPAAILLWGLEYWLWQASQDRLDWLEAAQSAILMTRS